MERLDQELPRPIYVEIDKLARVVLKSVRSQLNMRTDETALGVEMLPPPGIDAKKLGLATYRATRSAMESLKSQPVAKLGLFIVSLASRRDGASASYSLG